jgi:hypothetical protein
MTLCIRALQDLGKVAVACTLLPTFGIDGGTQTARFEGPLGSTVGDKDGGGQGESNRGAAEQAEFDMVWPPLVALHKDTIDRFANGNPAPTVRLHGVAHSAYINHETEVVGEMRKSWAACSRQLPACLPAAAAG